MGNAVFPDLPGLTWDVGVMPTLDTLISRSANRRSVRIPMMLDPLYLFSLSFEFLRDSDGFDEFNTLWGFYLARLGSADSFLLDLSKVTQNPAHAQAEDVPLTLDAANCVSAARPVGLSGTLETIYELQGAPVVKSAGTPLVLGVDYNLCNHWPASTAVMYAQYQANAAGDAPPQPLGTDATVDWDTVTGGGCTVHVYGRLNRLPDPAKAASCNLYWSDGTTYPLAAFTFAAALSTTYWLLYSPAANTTSHVTTRAAAIAAVAAGQICLGTLTTPNVSSVGGTTGGGGFGLATSGYGGYYFQFIGSPTLPLSVDLSWFYRVIFETGKANSSSGLGNDAIELKAKWLAMWDCKAVVLEGSRE